MSSGCDGKEGYGGNQATEGKVTAMAMVADRAMRK